MARVRRAPLVKVLERVCVVEVMGSLESFPRQHQEMLEDGGETKDGEKCERADNDDGRHKKNGEERRGNREGSRGFGNGFLFGQATGDGENGNDGKKSSKKSSGAGGGVVPERVGVQAGKCGAIVAGRGGVGVEDLRQAMGAGIRDARNPER